MNTALVMQGLAVANQLRSALQSNKKDKKTTVYDELRASSANISDLRSYLEELDRKEEEGLSEKEAQKRREARAKAGPVTQAAHVRLENRKKRLMDRKAAADALDFTQLDDRVSTPTRRPRRVSRSAAKRQKKMEQAQAKARQKAQARAKAKARRGKKFRGLGVTAGIIALFAALGGAVYFFIFGGPGRSPKQQPATTPPRVEEHSGERQSNLVYSTSTEKPAGDLAEEPAERDEELLGSLDDQLAAHRREEGPVVEASTSIDDATERLRRETEQAEAEFEAQFEKRKRTNDTNNTDATGESGEQK